MRHLFGLALLALAIVGAGVIAAGGMSSPASSSPSETKPARIVSLAPAITETLFEIGAGEAVVGVSDYCSHPPAACKLPGTGTVITPRYEAIARLEPTLIFGEANKSTRRTALAAIAPTHLLEWLTLKQITSSIRRLGQLTGREAPATQLANRLSSTLSATPPPDAPQVLLVLGNQGDQLDQVWFIRQNSLHGAALRAAGARNAVQREVSGAPKLSIEELLRVDPDAIVILVDSDLSPSQRRRLLAQWRQLKPLRAVKSRRLSVLAVDDPFATGPRILHFTERLAAHLEQQELNLGER